MAVEAREHERAVGVQRLTTVIIFAVALGFVGVFLIRFELLSSIIFGFALFLVVSAYYAVQDSISYQHILSDLLALEKKTRFQDDEVLLKMHSEAQGRAQTAHNEWLRGDKQRKKTWYRKLLGF